MFTEKYLSRVSILEGNDAEMAEVDKMLHLIKALEVIFIQYTTSSSPGHCGIVFGSQERVPNVVTGTFP